MLLQAQYYFGSLEREIELTTTKVSELGQKILAAKYYQDGEKSPEDVFRRVAKVAAIPDVIDSLILSCKGSAVPLQELSPLFYPYADQYIRVLQRRSLSDQSATVIQDSIKSSWEKEAAKYFHAMSNLDFMPGTPVLMNSGKEGARGMLASCFFLRLEDDLMDIFEAVKHVARISQLGGGVGLDVSNLRPQGSLVGGTQGVSSGPVSFLQVFDETGNQVAQGGQRRAALLAALSVDHPDIIKFVRAKETEGVLANFNLSVLLTDAFMDQLQSNPQSTWITSFGDKHFVLNIDTGEYIDSNSNETETTTVYATVQDIWDLIVKHAWRNGEPGVLFDGPIQKSDLFEGKYGRTGVNPCTELLLLHGESCILGAINLSNCVDETATPPKILDEKVRELVELGIWFLDNTVDLTSFPLAMIEEESLRGRKIGLGTMGLHDMLLKMKISYGSEESLKLIDSLYAKIHDWGYQASENIAEQRGIPKAIEAVGKQVRNSSILTAQPTGTVSLISGCSSGIEPNFQWSYTRKDSYGDHWIKHFLLQEFGSEEELPSYAKTALEIPPEDHVKVQATIQKHVCSNLSKTVNLPNSATVKDVAAIYRKAYDLGCKSTTVYRSGSRKSEVLSAKVTEQEKSEPQTTSPVRDRPFVLFGCTYKMNTPGGMAYVTINEDDEGIRECFISISKAGSDVGSHVAAEGRLISNSLQYRVPVESIISHLKGQKSTPIWAGGELINSVPDAVGKLLEDFVKNYEGFSEYLDKDRKTSAEHQKSVVQSAVEPSGEFCPECGESLYMESGCSNCKSCGYSRCGS